MRRFADRRAIVTGAGSGIGQATVARLLDEGATIVAYDISTVGLAATTAAAEEAGTAKRLTTAVLDISVEDDVIAAVDAVVADFGGIDVLVNVAGMQTCSNTHETTLADWNRTLAVNLTGTFLMTRQALPALLQCGRGVVVNFTSTSASFAHPYVTSPAAGSRRLLLTLLEREGPARPVGCCARPSRPLARDASTAGRRTPLG
ncbi:Dihydroanticapsin 7-dehydrogenase [Mycobacterium simulans]|uniref:Dihydroanticapsin 7-dehydrogenase n=1 Tax=Mycobacterium simulans TaxID=627089 RepID=A0A7Z7IK58_9MYCO|nr:Dihydroanticapsin 7-dehydrogenase [Mycobacterium simulans]